MCEPAKDKEINQKIIMMPHIEKLSPLTHGSCSVQLIKYFHTTYKLQAHTNLTPTIFMEKKDKVTSNLASNHAFNKCF